MTSAARSRDARTRSGDRAALTWSDHPRARWPTQLLDGGADVLDVTASGTVEGRPVIAYVLPGGAAAAAIEHGAAAGTPVVGLYVGGDEPGSAATGAGTSDAIHAAAALAAAAGRAPRIGVVLGRCVGPVALAAAQCDLLVMIDDAVLALDGPPRIRATTGEQVDLRSLGGSDVHGARTGLAHLVVDDEDTAMAAVRELLLLTAPAADATRSVVPLPAVPLDGDGAADGDRWGPTDVRQLVRRFVDAGRFLELQPAHAPNLVVGLARVDGATVGVLATQPRWLGGALDRDAAAKGVRFVALCRRLGFPVVVVLASGATVPGSAQEHAGGLGEVAALVAALADPGLRRVDVVVGDADGPAAATLLARVGNAPTVLAWPDARLPAGLTRAVQRIPAAHTGVAIGRRLGVHDPAPAPMER